MSSASGRGSAAGRTTSSPGREVSGGEVAQPASKASAEARRNGRGVSIRRPLRSVRPFRRLPARRQAQTGTPAMGRAAGNRSSCRARTARSAPGPSRATSTSAVACGASTNSAAARTAKASAATSTSAAPGRPAVTSVSSQSLWAWLRHRTGQAVHRARQRGRPSRTSRCRSRAAGRYRPSRAEPAAVAAANPPAGRSPQAAPTPPRGPARSSTPPAPARQAAAPAGCRCARRAAHGGAAAARGGPAAAAATAAPPPRSDPMRDPVTRISGIRQAPASRHAALRARSARAPPSPVQDTVASTGSSMASSSA